jgi:hypothetical protein
LLTAEAVRFKDSPAAEKLPRSAARMKARKPRNCSTAVFSPIQPVKAKDKATKTFRAQCAIQLLVSAALASYR